MGYRAHEAQPHQCACFGGYCWRQWCPVRPAMRRHIMQAAIERDTGRTAPRDVAGVPDELMDEDRG